MKRFFFVAISLFVWLGALAQESRLINIDPTSFRPVQTDALSGVVIDPIGVDRSKRPCARVKMHINRMTRDEIANLEVRLPGGNVVLMKKVVAVEGNGLIFELTAKEQTRFYLHHEKYGDSNEVTVNLEGNKEYRINAQLDLLLSVTVASNIKGADVYVDDQYKGVIGDDYMLTVKDITPGEHRIVIKHGASTAEKMVDVNSENISFRVEVNTATSRPQYVVFELNPSHAIVFIDNEPQVTQEGYVTAVLQNGTYSYRVIAKGYHEQRGTFTVSGERVVLPISLVADVVMVTLTTDAGVEIWINNQKKGVGGWKGQLPSGTYIFEARKEGHRTTTLSREITSSTTMQSYTLDAPTPIIGSLNITSVPAMANVKIDGKAVGTTPMIDDILVGKHTVEVSKSGYDTWRSDVFVTDGQITKRNVKLTEKKKAQNTFNYYGVRKKKYLYRNGAFNVGVFADVAMLTYDNSLFGLGTGLMWRPWRYNSFIVPFIGFRYMGGFDNTLSIGFPITINFNYFSWFADTVAMYIGIGVEPSYRVLKKYYYSEVSSIYRCWDFPIVLNWWGCSFRHHDFNFYCNFGFERSILYDDNSVSADIAFGGRYTYFF